jgi:hypothetical protein
VRVFARGEVETRGESEEGEGGVREKRDERDERAITGHVDERGLVSDFVLRTAVPQRRSLNSQNNEKKMRAARSRKHKSNSEKKGELK